MIYGGTMTDDDDGAQLTSRQRREVARAAHDVTMRLKRATRELEQLRRDAILGDENDDE